MLNDKGKVEGEMDYEERAPKRASRQVLLSSWSMLNGRMDKFNVFNIFA